MQHKKTSLKAKTLKHVIVLKNTSITDFNDFNIIVFSC